MFYVNDIPLNYANNGVDKFGKFKFADSKSSNDPNCTWVAEGIAKITERKMAVVIKFCESERTFNKAASKEAGIDIYDYPESRPLNVYATIDRNGRREVWRWSDAPKTLDPKTGENKYFPHRFINFGAQYNGLPPMKQFNPSMDAEQIWFLENVNNQKGKDFEFVNEVADAKIVMDEERSRVVLSSILDGLDHSLPDNIIPQLAEAYNVAGIQDLKNSYKSEKDALIIIRKKLFDTVKAKFDDPRHKTAVEDFKALTKDSTSRKLRSTVQRAYESGIVKQRQIPGKGISWFWGEEGSEICNIKSNYPMEDLVQYFIKRPPEQEKLFEDLGEVGAIIDTTISDEYTSSSLDELQELYLRLSGKGQTEKSRKGFLRSVRYSEDRNWMIEKIKEIRKGS